MTEQAQSHVHRWIAGEGGRTLLLLHGTGGDENDLIPLARSLDARASLLSPRGNVLENGMPRFFRRHAVGVLDVDDLKRRARELAAFTEDAARRYGFPPGSPTALGFSNGANVAVGLLFEAPHAIAGAILLRPMLAYEPERPPDLAGKRILVLAGERDPYSPRESVEALARILREGGARVEVRTARAGHEIAPSDVEAARAWLAEEGD